MATQGAADVAALRARVAWALELVADPAAEALKRGRAPLDREVYRDAIRHVWALLKEAYGIELGADFFSVHRENDPLNCLALTPSAAEAADVARWWAGPPVSVTPVCAVERAPERWVAMGVALHWRRPAWLPLPPPQKNTVPE